jgi:hypothetical protein
MTRLIELERARARRPTRDEVARAFAWCIAGPALAAWPFLSVFPLFEMLSGGAGIGLVVTRSLLLASGFWAVSLLFAAYLLAHAGGAAAALSARRRDGGLSLGLYAAAWTTLYLVVFLLV